MTTATARRLRRELVDTMVADGTIQSAWVRDAFDTVPREVFAPRFYRRNGHHEVLVDGTKPDQHAEWLRGVYTDQVLTVQLTANPSDPTGVPTSSSSMPTVMAGMLEALDLQPGHRLMEIGTGTGYNAALVCHRLDNDRVTSIELDPQLADAARGALAQVGLYPLVHLGDGAVGMSAAGPFDRIIATAAVDHIPPAWIEQLAPGGIIVANLRGDIAGGIVRLTRSVDGGEASGPFLAMEGAFMPMRTPLMSTGLDGQDWSRAEFDMRNPRMSRTVIDAALFGDRSFRFLAQLHLAGRRLRGFAPPGVDSDAVVSGRAADGSWFDIHHADAGTGEVVRQGGPQRLWDTVEVAHTTWKQLDRPTTDRFTVVADLDVDLQHIMYRGDGLNEHRWPLPL